MVMPNVGTSCVPVFTVVLVVFPDANIGLSLSMGRAEELQQVLIGNASSGHVVQVGGDYFFG